MADKSWDYPTRALHWAIAAVITLQLASGLKIADPNTRFFFYAHESIGLLAGLIILGHWIWSFANYDLHLLFPWGAAGRAKIKAELGGLRRGELPDGGREAGLSNFVHGLGLLAVTGMALSGFWIFTIIPGGPGASSGVHDYRLFTFLSVVHSYLGYLVWAYWLAHVGTALLHLIKGHPIFAQIFLDAPHEGDGTNQG